MTAIEERIRQWAVDGVAGLAPYQPGMPESELRRQYGVDIITKLASNENPLGPSPAAAEAARDAVLEAHRYPDGNGFELKGRIAARHGVRPEQITLGNGSNDVLALVAQTFLGPGRAAVFSAHAFAVYPIVTRSVGARMVVVPAREPGDPQPYGHDEAALRDAIDGESRVVFFANPNNPTGTWTERSALRSFIESIPRDVVVVVDEAYFEYAAEDADYPDATEWLDDFPNLIVTRSFSKIFGLGGLRVGYALSHPAVADLMNRVRQPFNCSAPAQAAATAALADNDHIVRSVELNRRERGRLDAALRQRGFAPLPSLANFLTFRLGEPDRAAALHEGLLREGVIVRPVDAYELPGFTRVTVGTEAENDRFLAALDRVVERAA